jgi:hypothetical protein
MFYIFQYAYTKFDSTESALLVIHDHFIKSIDRQQVTGLTLLDLSAAFDTIDHSILLLVWYMRQCFHLVPVLSVLQVLFCPCLDNLSTSLPLSCGVSPSSVLGHILFIMHTTPLSSLISQMSACNESQVNHHIYAEDT